MCLQKLAYSFSTTVAAKFKGSCCDPLSVAATLMADGCCCAKVFCTECGAY